MLYFITFMSNYDNAKVIEISQQFDRITLGYRLPLLWNEFLILFLPTSSARSLCVCPSIVCGTAVLTEADVVFKSVSLSVCPSVCSSTQKLKNY